MAGKSAKTAARRKPGRLFAIGGAEDPDEAHMKILPHLVAMAGGRRARVLVCGSASENARQKERTYEKLFTNLGVSEVIESRVVNRKDAEDEELAKQVDRATAVFITGGDQLRLTSTIAGTKFGDRIRDRLAKEGLIVAGTSAGAAAMSSTMIIGGKNNATARRGDTDLAPGLGYWRDACVDSHFAQRGRVSRLLTLFAQNPQILGIGIDENTAVDVQPGKRFTVVGEGVVYVFDGRVSHSNAAEVGGEDGLALADISLHALPNGYGFDIEKKRPMLPDGSIIEQA